MSNDTRQVCGWVGGRICHLDPGHTGEHRTVDGPTADALKARTLKKLEAEWEVLYRRIWEGDRELAGEVDDNISGRMGAELRPLVKAGRTILGTPGGHEAMGKVAEAVLPALLERHDPTF